MVRAPPQRVEAFIVQGAVAHREGLGANGKARRAFWADRAPNESALRANLLSLAATRTPQLGNDPNVDRYAPDLWTDEFYFLNRSGQAEIQSDLFCDYRTNVDAPSSKIGCAFHIVDGDHFALDTASDQIAALVQGFLESSRDGMVARRAG